MQRRFRRRSADTNASVVIHDGEKREIAVSLRRQRQCAMASRKFILLYVQYVNTADICSLASAAATAAD